MPTIFAVTVKLFIRIKSTLFCCWKTRLILACSNHQYSSKKTVLRIAFVQIGTEKSFSALSKLLQCSIIYDIRILSIPTAINSGQCSTTYYVRLAVWPPQLVVTNWLWVDPVPLQQPALFLENYFDRQRGSAGHRRAILSVSGRKMLPGCGAVPVKWTETSQVQTTILTAGDTGRYLVRLVRNTGKQ